MLIVIAIIAILISIAIPIFWSQLEKARQSVDLANMRSAYGVATTEWMMAKDKPSVYYFNGSNVVTSPEGIGGYGQSTANAADFSENLPVPALGVPRTGRQNYIILYMGDQGVDHIVWSSGGYAGLTVSNLNAHNAIKNNAVELDTTLLDSLEEEARRMTYGELKALIAKYHVTTGNISWNGQSHSAMQIGLSSVDEASGQVVSGKNGILVPEIFEAAGYDMSVSADNQYILNSRDKYTKGDIIWLDLGANLKNVNDNDLASNAVVYVKSNGDNSESFSYANRMSR